MILINKKAILDNILATFEIEQMEIPADKKELLRQYLEHEITEEELIELNKLRIQNILERHQNE